MWLTSRLSAYQISIYPGNIGIVPHDSDLFKS